MTTLRAQFEVNYPGFRLDVDMEVPTDGAIAVFGHSGCGKSTLLRCLAGLCRAPRGFMRIGDEVWQDEAGGLFQPVHRRAVGYVFQDLRLFPHLSVRSNLEYGLSRTPPAERRFDFDRVVDLLGIGRLLDRRPSRLSGGEQQRVAIGRAVLTSPQLLLFDEPLSSLDWRVRSEILPFIQRLDAVLRIPIVYVSHALNEVLQLSKTLIVMRGGRVEAVGPINEVLARFDLRGAIEPDRLGALIDARVVGHEPEFGLTRVEFRGRSLYVPYRPRSVGEPLRVHILAKDVSLVTGGPPLQTSVLNILEGTIESIGDTGGDEPSVHVRLDVGCPLLASITKKSVSKLGLGVGQRVYAQIKALALSDDLRI